MRELLIKWSTNAFVVALAGCIPFGLVMAFYMDDAKWLWFCAPLLIFLS
jgi:hypothetical protein